MLIWHKCSGPHSVSDFVFVVVLLVMVMFVVVLLLLGWLLTEVRPKECLKMTM